MSETQRSLEPIAVCKCGRAAAFDLVTTYQSRGGFNRSGGWRTRRVKVCGTCAAKLSPGITDRKFAADDEAVPIGSES